MRRKLNLILLALVACSALSGCDFWDSLMDQNSADSCSWPSKC